MQAIKKKYRTKNQSSNPYKWLNICCEVIGVRVFCIRCFFYYRLFETYAISTKNNEICSETSKLETNECLIPTWMTAAIFFNSIDSLFMVYSEHKYKT